MTGEERLADSPWWKEGGADELEESFKYPPELLGTSWGSYLASMPATAHPAGRKVVLAGRDERITTRQSEDKLVSPLKGSQRQSILRTKDSTTPTALPPARMSASSRRSQPRPHFLQHLSAALQRTVDSLVSCGIDAFPFSRAFAAVTEFLQTQHKEGSSEVVISTEMEESIEIVLEALVSQAKIMEEHAKSLKTTAAVLTRNQKQFVREKQEMQQTIEAAFSHIVAQQKLLEERKVTLSKKDTLCHKKQKSYTVGLREGQHRLALMQTRKEHLRLEKTLLQQQRDLRKLEEAYKTTKAELAAEQYNYEQLYKKALKSEFSRHSQMGVFGLREKFLKHNQELGKLVHQLEVSRRGLAETGHRLRGSGREAHIPVTATHGSSLHLPHINTANSPLRNHKNSPSSTQSKLPLIDTHGPYKPRPPGKGKNISCSELMELAHFRSPKVAREVISWLERQGAISDK